MIAAKFCKMLNGKTKALFLVSDLKPTEKYVSDAGKLKAVFEKLLSRQKLLIPAVSPEIIVIDVQRGRVCGEDCYNIRFDLKNALISASLEK